MVKRTKDGMAAIYPLIIGALFSGNMFFLKRMVDRLDSVEAIAVHSRQDIAVIQAVQDTQTKRREHDSARKIRD